MTVLFQNSCSFLSLQRSVTIRNTLGCISILWRTKPLPVGYRLRTRLAEFLHIRGILPSITVRPNMTLYAKLSAYVTRSLLKILKILKIQPSIERQNNIRTFLRTSFVFSQFKRSFQVRFLVGQTQVYFHRIIVEL